MPRFYFNLCNGAEFAEDLEGVELADYAAARRTAVESLRGVMSGDVLMGDLNTASFIEIEDEQHELIEMSVTLVGLLTTPIRKAQNLRIRPPS